MLDLLDGYLASRLVRGHTVLIENVGPTARGFWQHDHRRELPAKGDGLFTFWQIVHMNGASIRRGPRTGTGDVTGVYRCPQVVACRWPGRILRQHRLQAFDINTSIFKSFIQARPFPCKTWRERQFGKRLRSLLGDQRIHRVKQAIFGSLKTVINPVTKLFQCVKVHVRNAPLFSIWNFTRLASFPQGMEAFCRLV